MRAKERSNSIGRSCGEAALLKNTTWLIRPVVICLPHISVPRIRSFRRPAELVISLFVNWTSMKLYG
ncbi:hypothetical protein K2173_014861 [Erythroxylum novogranatense]|uniref:Uncharacterized protein n=1 Tax=Erythroxylum novogranatense TaxID=1862640 RepID=A0AAV8THT0_9ROSI|nr:hypothetical protein K2173_014861 [Erythroxylum novogranatense]